MINTVLPPLRPIPTRHLHYFQHIPCSYGCNGYAHNGNALGTRWCLRCYQRYMLVEQVQTHYDLFMLDRKAIARSHLNEWLTFARTGSVSEIEQAVRAMRGVA